MYGKLKILLGLCLISATPTAFAQYTIDLTGVGNGAVANGVYVSPYQGTITGNGASHPGYVICDDFYTDSYLNTLWSASMIKRRHARRHREISRHRDIRRDQLFRPASL